jgi:hypothetical protein
MDLKTRYESAAASTYVGKVRTTQEADVGVGRGVDFMDAGAGKGNPDNMQSNFQRRAADNTTVTQGTDTTYSATDLKGSSRWYGKALNYAFTDPNSATTGITVSQWNSFKNKRTGTKDTWTDNTYFHRWTPSAQFKASETLSALAKTRATGKAPSA